jgi:hypothetical protein
MLICHKYCLYGNFKRGYYVSLTDTKCKGTDLRQTESLN